MHSNFITPPDYVKTILVIGATEQQIKDLGEYVRAGNVPYNMYFYNEAMNQPEWVLKISAKSDAIIYADKFDPIEFLNK